MIDLLDVLFGGCAAWRRLRGGKWEHLSACCVCPVDSWERVDLFRAGYWPTVLEREVYDEEPEC